MKRTCIAAVVSMMFFSSFTSSYAEVFSTKQGDMWFGGGMMYTTTGVKVRNFDYDFDRMNLIAISPIIRFFPVDHFLFGPKFEWVGMYQGDDMINILNFGGEIGCAFNASVYPYFFTSPHVQIAGDGSGDSESAFGLPFTVGILVPIAEHLAIQFETGLAFGFDDDVTTNTFSISFGLCGFASKAAVSALSTISNLGSSF